MVSRRIVEECHAKTKAGAGGVFPDTPIGKGGKRDDTSCVVGEVVEFTEAHREVWSRIRRQQKWQSLLGCGGCGTDLRHPNWKNLLTCGGFGEDLRSCYDEDDCKGSARTYPHGPSSMYSDSEYGSPDDDDSRCCIL